MLRLLLAALIILFSSEAKAVVYFDSDLNVPLLPNGQTNSDGWTAFGQSTGWTSIMISGGKMTGSWMDPQPCCGNGGVAQANHIFPNTTVVYGRMYHYYSIPFNLCNSADPNWATIKPHCGSDAVGNGNVKIVFTERNFQTGGGSGNNPRLIVGTSFGGYAYDLQSSYDNWPCPHPDGPTHLCGQSTLFRSGVPPSTDPNNPSLVEWAIILNTPNQQNGSGFLWINGVLKVSLTNREFIGPLTTSKDKNAQIVSSDMVYGNFQFVSQNQAAYGSFHVWDHLAAGNARIGPFGGAIDTTPPTPPSQLQIR